MCGSHEGGCSGLGDLGVSRSDTVMLALDVKVKSRVGFICFGTATTDEGKAIFVVLLVVLGDFKTAKL